MNVLTNFFVNHWLAMAFLAPMFWSLISIIDAYFVKGVYRDEYDGAIIASMFQIWPCLAMVLFFKIDLVGALIHAVYNGGLIWGIISGLIAGIFFSFSYLFYFKTLFRENDAALLQIIWSSSSIFVPLFAFLLFRERLEFISYFGIFLIMLGAMALSFNKTVKTKISFAYLRTMLFAVLSISFSMVMISKTQNYFFSQNFSEMTAFLAGFFVFGVGTFLAGFLLALFRKNNPWTVIKNNWWQFILLEVISFLGNLSSQRSISIAPSVSFVAAIETFAPVFVLIYSIVILIIFKYLSPASKHIARKIYQEQLDGWAVKILATLVMTVGVYLL